MTDALPKIIPTAIAQAAPLHTEFQTHMDQAQRYYEAAMRAVETDKPGAGVFFNKAVVEQNAAILCQGQIQVLLLSGLLRLLDDDRHQPAVGGAVQ